MDKVLRFLEDHVEKIVLGIVLIISLWLIVTRVVLSPNSVSYEGQNLSPGAIDGYIRDEALKLEEAMNRRPTEPDVHKPRLGEYSELLNECSIRGVDFGISLPVPQSNPQGGTIVRKYNLPDVGAVDEVVVGRIRTVAYTPFEQVTAESAYDSSNSEPNDLDLVTVQGTYDIAALYASFEDSFAGAGVKPQWRDPCLAEPVFAAVHLQRQKIDEDGVWGQWEDVPRTKIDCQRELFAVIEDARSLPPGGLAVRMLQYSNSEVQMDLLQPAAYRIASANEEWFPPLLYEEYKTIRAAEALEERRQAKEEEEEKSAAAGSDTGRRRTSLTSSRRNPGGAGSVSDNSRTSSGRRTSRTGTISGPGQSGSRYSASRSRTARSRTGRDETDESQAERREAPAKPTVEDVRNKLKELSIESIAGLARRGAGELVFWAHDDTVGPGGEYRYRVRLGVFNPVAGKNQLSQRDAARNNEVILWSAFSDPSESIEVPRRLYFFAKGIQEAAKEVTVQVSKYMLGYWYSEDFKVKGGEIIGDLVETEAAKKRAELAGETVYTASESALGVTDAAEPEAVDYDTGAVLVDVVPVNDWAGDSTMRARQYFEMLYSYDGSRIERMPVGDRYWPEELLIMRSEIRNSQREPKQPLRPWASAGTGVMGRTATRRPYSRSTDYE